MSSSAFMPQVKLAGDKLSTKIINGQVFTFLRIIEFFQTFYKSFDLRVKTVFSLYDQN